MMNIVDNLLLLISVFVLRVEIPRPRRNRRQFARHPKGPRVEKEHLAQEAKCSRPEELEQEREAEVGGGQVTGHKL